MIIQCHSAVEALTKTPRSTQKGTQKGNHLVPTDPRCRANQLKANNLAGANHTQTLCCKL